MLTKRIFFFVFIFVFSISSCEEPEPEIEIKPTVLGTWKLIDFEAEEYEVISINGNMGNQNSEVMGMLSSAGEIVISENPNTISSTCTFQVEVNIKEGEVDETKEKSKTWSNAVNWTKSDNEFQVFWTNTIATNFFIESLSDTELILTENLENTYDFSGYTFEESGFRKYTFER